MERRKRVGSFPFSFLLFFFLMIFSSCIYRMPTEDDVSVLPNTNNPEVVGERGNKNLIPGMQM